MTSHRKGVLHFNIFNEFVISYGVYGSEYSINIHNHETLELLHHSCTNDNINQFIVVSHDVVVSLPQLRIWKNLYPSSCYSVVTAGCLLPRCKDLLFGVGQG